MAGAHSRRSFSGRSALDCLPSEWVDSLDFPDAGALLVIQGLRARHLAQAGSSIDQASVQYPLPLFSIFLPLRTNLPIPKHCRFYYFEVKIVKDGGCRDIGFS